MSAALLSAREVRFRYREQEVLAGVDLEMGEGEVVILLGPNGGGKSTLIKAVLGLVPKEGGEVEILGRPVYRKLADVPQPLDMVNVFRRSHDIPQHVPDILAARPKVVWIQTGIRHDAVAEALARAGIKVVQDR